MAKIWLAEVLILHVHDTCRLIVLLFETELELSLKFKYPSANNWLIKLCGCKL